MSVARWMSFGSRGYARLSVFPAKQGGQRLMRAVQTNLHSRCFTDGFTEEMIAELGKLDPDHLGVIARTTMLYKGARKSVGRSRASLA